LSDTLDGVQTPHDELRSNYPDSEIVLRAAKQLINTISTEPDDARRVGLIQTFLADYPGCYWRHHAYRFWLFSAWRLNDNELLKAAADAYLSEYPDTGSSLGAVSRYLYDAGFDLARGRTLAERCVAVFERELGTDGTESSLRRLDRESRLLPRRPDHLPPGLRSNFMEYLGSRFNLARYYVMNKSPVAALRQLIPVLAAAPFSTEDEETIAPFLYTAGQSYEQQDKSSEAFRHYLGAAMSGDSRQRYSSPAAERLAVLGPQISINDQREMIDGWLDPNLRGISLPRFTEVAERSGLGQVAAQRAAWADVDGDRDPDLLLDGKHLYINDGAGKFARLADSGISGDHVGGVFGDYNNDGWLDLYCFGSGRRGDALYRNDRGRFSDITASAGSPVDNSHSEAATWLDYDRDGNLDLFVANFESRSGRDDSRGSGEPSLLYRNSGMGTLRLVPHSESGLAPPVGGNLPSRGVSPADIDGNGWPDLFVGSYRLQENLAWLNNGGTFSNRARPLGLAGNPQDGYWGHTLGSAWGDVDNNGRMDVFVCNLAHQRYSYISDRSQLLINGAGSDTIFADERMKRGIAFIETNTDAVFADFNSDGHLDLFITANFPSRPSYLYVNDGKGKFHDVTFLAGARIANAYGCAIADYDQDGDLDLIVCSANGVSLLRNDSPPQDWILLRLTGGSENSTGSAPDGLPWSNSRCIGARVTVRRGSMQLTRELQSSRGVGCGDEAVLHFGLGKASAPGGIGINVRYPSGREWNTVVYETGGTYSFNERDALAEQAEGMTTLQRVPTRGN
jgi:hypothetical protein